MLVRHNTQHLALCVLSTREFEQKVRGISVRILRKQTIRTSVFVRLAKTEAEKQTFFFWYRRNFHIQEPSEV